MGTILGRSSTFFALAPKRAFLSDSNRALIECYKHVRDDPETVHRNLRKHLRRTSEQYYYKVRDIYNDSEASTAQAARFIYLNKTSFNGIFRVNTKGEYNVPYGHKEPPALPTLEELRKASSLLRKTNLAIRSFDELFINRRIREGDLVYLDPPYPPLNETANFTHYTVDRFSWRDHEKVASLANSLRKKGCFVMISNVDLPIVRKLYKGWEISRLNVMRWIAANGTRKHATEVVITSYEK